MIKSGQWKAMQNNELDEKGGEMEETGVDGETEDVDKVDEKEIENDETMDLIQEATSMEASISKGIPKIKSIIKTNLNIKFVKVMSTI